MRSLYQIAQHSTLNCGGSLLTLATPIVMGILNITPDSFWDGGQYLMPAEAIIRTQQMLDAGATIIDIGGVSTKPGANIVSIDEELSRIYDLTATLLARFPTAIFSVDTFRSAVAKELLQLGIHIINDISGGKHDKDMFKTVADYKAPYIMMHLHSTVERRHDIIDYNDVQQAVFDTFIQQINAAHQAGITDIIIDPGFGFNKSLEDSYKLFQHLSSLTLLGLPILIGISRKSMFTKLLEITKDETLPYVAALHLQALMAGVKILRVHDVKEAVNIIKIYNTLK